MAKKGQSAKKQQAKKKPERGAGLSIMLVLVMLSNLLSVFLVLDLTKRPNDPTFPVLLALFTVSFCPDPELHALTRKSTTKKTRANLSVFFI